MGGSPSERTIVSIRRWTGLGDHLICLAAAWRFARDTGRTLVADWRFSPYTLAAKDNLFPLCFEAPAKLAGVRFVSRNDLAGLVPDDEAMRRASPDEIQRPPHIEAVAHIAESRDLETQTVVFNTCVNHGITRIADLLMFYTALKPVGPAAAAVSAFRASLPPSPLIGLHIRHGNGAQIPGYAPHWQSMSAGIERCLKAVAAARAQLGTNARIFLCTDSVEVEAAVASRIPDVLTRRKILREAGDGELHLWRGAALGRDDAVVEMLLLAECDGLIRYPAPSFFSIY